MTWAARAVFAACAIATGCYYEWGVRATGYDFTWGRSDLTGYYNYLARGFAEGHLYLPVEPDPKLLAYPNPLDPNIPEDVPKLFDAVLYNRHYYLYHGVAPAIMLFLPYRLATGHDLPEGFALFLMCFGGYLFAAGTLLSLLRMAEVEASARALAFLLLSLGFCQSVPFLLNRIWVYEIAIGGGYFCVSAGLFFLTRSLQSVRRIWPASAGFMLGMAVACRPHLIIAAAFATAAAVLALRRRAVDFAIPLIAVGILIGIYNAERFGSPADFGVEYQITGPFQGAMHPGAANILPGLYYMLFEPPEFSKVFPWVLIPWPPRGVPRPPHYFIEPIVGALFLAPFLPAGILTLRLRKLGGMRWVPLASAGCILAFLVTTGLSTQRYEVDFLPLLVLSAAIGLAWWISKGLTKRLAAGVLAGGVVFGMAVNLAMGITGPYDEMMKNKPARYVAIARRLTPAASLRPELDPAISADVRASIGWEPDHYREDLFSAGRQPWKYELFIDHLNGKPVLVSRIAGSVVTKELDDAAEPVTFHVAYSPAAHEMSVAENGSEVVRQRIDTLITAPAQIAVKPRNP